ncbi:MAG: sugar ABC transporter ATP-binding protein [Pirellulaceae bacterium]|nr:sugar ABC transporter ATP-binding protein [Pirellulaceae bacterium]
MLNNLPPLLEVRQITKQFPGVRALRGVDLQLGTGEVLAVIGENGAGKSTLMKILAGVQSPDAGDILIDGRPVKLDSVASALESRIALIHQELNLATNLQVGANIYLGREPRRLGIIDRRKLNRDANEVLARLGLAVKATEPLSRLSIGKQQLVEIAKAMSVNARVLIMDEPTSSLSSYESEQLFKVVKDLRAKGISVVYISHRLAEVRELADRVVVLRDGANAGELAGEEITHNNMVQMMVGREISQYYGRQSHPIGDTVLQVDDLVTSKWPKHASSFSIRRGEIVGIAGLVGAGRSELLQTLFGIDRPIRGTVRMNGKLIRLKNPRDAIHAGMALVPEDRKHHGLIVDMPVRENIGLASLRAHQRFGGFRNAARERSDSRQMIDKLRIKTPHDRQITRFLSGGNQQKIVIGKWLALNPSLLLLDEPTRGIDVGAKQEIYRLMEQLAKDGMSILFVSSELEEIIGMSDRTLVMHEGRLAGELQRNELTEQAIMALATGQN